MNCELRMSVQPPLWFSRNFFLEMEADVYLNTNDAPGLRRGLHSKKGKKALIINEVWRCPGPPEPAVTSRGRRTPLPAPPFRIVSRRRPSMSEDGKSCTINSLRSQVTIYVSKLKKNRTSAYRFVHTASS